MTIFQAIILGILQGLTEFLPISSSAHLVILPYLLNWSLPQEQVFPFDILVQLGTLIAVIIYFRNDLRKIFRSFFLGIRNHKPFDHFESRLGWLLILATIPAGLLGVLIKSQVEIVFHNPLWTAFFLLITAALLVASERFGKRNRKLNSSKWLDALIVGAFQAFSIFPGISRSGATISGGMFRKFDRPSAARFSFLMYIPVMLAASALSIGDLLKISNLSSFLPSLLIGFFLAGVVGYFSIHYLLKFISRHSFYPFALYCVILCAVVLTFSFFQPPVPSPLPTIATPQVVQISISPSVASLGSQLSDCARLQKNYGIIFDQVSLDALVNHPEPYIWWGQLENSSGFNFQLGEEKLVIIVNPQNLYSSIDLASLQNILSGVTRQWPGDSNQSVHVWVYSSLDDTQQVAASGLMQNAPFSPLAFLAADPEIMREVIAQDPLAIGFIPSRWLDSTVKALTVTGVDMDSLKAPILVHTSEPPAGTFEKWLACLQQMLNP
jgi:undecaprenyl-diphosphatase